MRACVFQRGDLFGVIGLRAFGTQRVIGLIGIALGAKAAADHRAVFGQARRFGCVTIKVKTAVVHLGQPLFGVSQKLPPIAAGAIGH